MDPEGKRKGSAERDRTLLLTKTSPNAVSAAEPSEKRTHCLVVMAGLDVGAVCSLETPQVVVGRDPSCDYVLGDDGISRRHASFRRAGELVIVTDLESTNGVYVNGSRIEEAALREGDKIQLGRSTVLKYTCQDDIELQYMLKMHESVSTDGLTGALNRRVLEDRLAAECSFAKRHGTTVSVMMLDVDHFKKVNDTYGHPAGDEVLKKLARTVRAVIRREDLFGRYGGEEFVLVARGIGQPGAMSLARRIRETIASLEIECDGRPVPVTVSIGVATAEGSEEKSPEALLRLADERLYLAKNGGRNREVGE